MKIGLFGGTFDPIHIGHLVVAQTSLEELNLDKIVFIPSKTSPFKLNTPHLFTDEQRLEMVRIAIEGEKKFEITDFEITSTGVSYTYLTVDFFSKAYRNDEIFLILGGDNFKTFCKWKNYTDILEKAKLIVYPRYRTTPKIPKCLDRFSERIIFLNAPILEISSTMIREKLKAKKEVKYFLPAGVYEYIRKVLDIST